MDWDYHQILNDYIIPWGIKLLIAVAIFVLGRWIAKAVVGVLRRVMRRTGMDDILVNFCSSILRVLLLVVVLVAALDQLGLNTTSLVAILGAAGLAIGLSLQDSLKNLAAGVMLVIFRPFKSGDFVEAGGVTGKVQEINILNTKLLTPDNKEVIVANGDVVSGTITNFTAMPTRRVDLTFGIGYGDDIDRAREIIKTVLAEHPLVLADPAPVVAVSALADSSVNFVVRPWAATDDYWQVYWDVTERVKRGFDDGGVSIPFPQMDVHLEKVA